MYIWPVQWLSNLCKLYHNPISISTPDRNYFWLTIILVKNEPNLNFEKRWAHLEDGKITFPKCISPEIVKVLPERLVTVFVPTAVMSFTACLWGFIVNRTKNPNPAFKKTPNAFLLKKDLGLTSRITVFLRKTPHILIYWIKIKLKFICAPDRLPQGMAQNF